jgi:hypothetical protein
LRPDLIFRMKLPKKSKKDKEFENEIKKSFLFPLCSHIQKSILVPIDSSNKNFKELDESLKRMVKVGGEFDAIEESMKKNMHNLPPELTHDIIFYVSNARVFLLLIHEFSETINKWDEKIKETIVPKKFNEGIRKITDIFNNMEKNLLSSVYWFMVEKTDYKKKIKTKKILKEIAKTLDKMTSEMR